MTTFPKTFKVISFKTMLHSYLFLFLNFLILLLSVPWCLASSSEHNSADIAVLEGKLVEVQKSISRIKQDITQRASHLSTDDVQLIKARNELQRIDNSLERLLAKRLANAEKDATYLFLRKKRDILKISLRSKKENGKLHSDELATMEKELVDLQSGMAKQLKNGSPELTREIRKLRDSRQNMKEMISWRIPIVFANNHDISKLIENLKNETGRRDSLQAEILHINGKIMPSEYLSSLPKPIFRQGHTLPPLTRYGWTLPIEVNVALAKEWGYALEMGGYWEQRNADRLTLPFSKEAKLVELAETLKLKVSVITNRKKPSIYPSGSWARNNNGKLLLANAKSYDGNEWHPGIQTVISPNAPDSLWLEYGRLKAEPIARLNEQIPIAIVLNGGEYGIGVMGFAAKAWVLDPKIRAAKNDRSWFEYISERKGHAESLIANAVRAAVPNRELYIYYKTGNPHRKRYPWYRIWGYDFKDLKEASDLASNAHYYKHFNSGFEGDEDMLTMATNVKAYAIAHQQSLDYSWFWGKDADIGRWMGFLKCLYVAGTVGGNAGWYQYADFNKSFNTEKPPDWLKDMIALSRVHALFSFLEEDVREGQLVPGPYWHAWSRELPAYELVPAELKEKGLGASKSHMRYAKPGRRLRVIARKNKTKSRWLIAAWAAYGQSSEVVFDLPGYGRLSLNARKEGAVYLLDAEKGNPHPALIDKDPSLPSHSAAKYFNEVK